MRVVLKPGGFIVVIAAIAALCGMIFLRPRAETAPVTTSEKAAPASDSSTIFRADMEHFQLVAVQKNSTATITGYVADPFSDNSEWAKLAVTYARHAVNPHGGTACQKIAVGTVSVGQMQFNHEFSVLEGTRVKATVWLRAEAPVAPGDVLFSLRDKPDANVWFGESNPLVTTEWQQFEVMGVTTTENPTFLMLVIRKSNTTVYMDDAEIIHL